jgi:hypothetical protein
MIQPFYICLLALASFYSIFFGYVIKSHQKESEVSSLKEIA